MNGDVDIIIKDNNSGSPSGSNFPLVVGTSTLGEVGKVVVAGSDTKLDEKFGCGNLVDKLKDMFNNSNSNAGAYVVKAASDIDGVIGTVRSVKTGDATAITEGEPLCNAEIVVKITKTGTLNTAEYRYSTDGGDNFSGIFTLPLDGVVVIGETGIKLVLNGNLSRDDTFSVDIKSKSASIGSILTAISEALEVYDIPFVFITEPTNSVDWAVLDIKAKELYNKKRPTFFLCSTRTPNENESVDEWVNNMVADSNGFASQDIVVCSGYGEIVDSLGQKKVRDISGIVAGIITKADVNQSIAEVAQFPISSLYLPEGFNSAHSTTLEDARYITVKSYAGLNSRFIVEGRTMAESTSDYQYLETLRTVYYAVRLARTKALTYVKSRATPINGDVRPILESIKQEITQYVKNYMVYGIPALLTNVSLELPEGQDINNIGLVFNMHLEGVPIIRNIKIYMDITYPTT